MVHGRKPYIMIFVAYDNKDLMDIVTQLKMAVIRELYLTSFFILFSQISGQWSGIASIKHCGSSDLTIIFNFSLGGENFLERYWSLNSFANKIAHVNEPGILTVEPPYNGRLTLSGTNGITLSHVNSSDRGNYLFAFITDQSHNSLTATTTVIINEIPNNSCIPITTNYINSITCKIPDACPGKDSIQARWNDGSIAWLRCPLAITKYNCCAVGDPVTNCYNGSLCTETECKDGSNPGSIHLSPNRTSHELTELSPLTVNCSADCFPDCKYTWTGPGDRNVSNTSLLFFMSVGRNQSGQYTCTASDSDIPIKRATTTISVTVFYGPDDRNVFLSPSNTSYQLIELSRLDVKCSATCEPQCDYQWSGPLVSQNDNMSWLSISNIQRTQNGTFTCTVTNPKVPGKSATASFSVIVYYGPDSNGITLSPSNTSYQLTESSPLTVQCTATCVPHCNYQWMGPGISQNDNHGLLSVSEISRNQSGTFTCTVTNPKNPGKNVTANISVIVYYGPDDRKVSLSPSNTSYQLTELSRLDVKCSATCEPQCNYQWSGPLVNQNNNMGLLSISHIQRNQNGTFICTVTNPKVPGKSATANFSVIVYYGPDSNGTTLFPSNTSYQLTESSPLTVQCTATCVPQCNYQWMGPGISLNDNRGLLSVSEISRNQSGTFTCTVTNPKNPGKNVTANISVIVYYGPDDRTVFLSPSNTSYQLTELSRLDVKCSATCEPQCDYQWSGPLVNQNDNMGLLSISHIQRNQNGTFICSVTNPKIPGKSATANFSVIVYYGPGVPYLSPSTAVYTRLEGESVPDIICSADCFPGCTQVWMKGLAVVQESNGKTLSLRQVTREKAGDYTCWFNNSETRATGNISIKLIVQYPPVLTMKATNTSKGGRVVINCTASGVPDNYTFYNLTHMAPDVSRTIVRELELTRVSNSDVSFTIERATYQDTGYYVCKASNGIVYNSSGQVFMEDMVSVLITDQPVITSNNRSFDVEKGKSGQMYIEFYSGLSQPHVMWYIKKNGTLELLQNASNFVMNLSAVIVEVKYYQTTVRLPGYNASLEVFDVAESQLTSYKVEINNGWEEPAFVILELKPRGPPETPTNLSVVSDSITTHSVQLSWRAEFHGGASQTFVIEYREVGQTDWLNKTEPGGLVLYVILNTTIANLKDGTKYEFRIYSENVYNRSQISSVINEMTKIAPKDEPVNSDGSPVIIGAATGSALVLVIAVVIAGFYFYKRRQNIKTSEDVDVLQDEKSLSDRHKSGLVDNPVYDSSDPLHDKSTSGSDTGVEYAAVVKPKKKGGQLDDLNVYAQVDKTKDGKKQGQVKQMLGRPQRGDIYENTTLAGRDNVKGNVYENPGELKTDENIYENPSENAPKRSLANKEGLLYADLVLDSSTTRNGKYVIRGLENRIEYAEIAYGKRGEPLPDNKKEI